MAGVNKVILVGNLGRDPELRYTQSGTAVCRLNLATTRTYNDRNNERQEETEWHRITVWGKQAEHCEKYLSKGRQVYVEGRLQTRSYEKDGVKRWSTEVIADTVQFLSGGGGGSGGGGNDSRSREQDAGPDTSPFGDNYPAGDPGDDDIPF